MEMFIAKTCLVCVYNSNARCHVTCVLCLVWQARSNRINSVSIAMRDVSSHRNTGCMFYVVAEHVSTEIQGVYFVLSPSLSSHCNRGSLVVSQNVNPPPKYRVYILCCLRTESSHLSRGSLVVSQNVRPPLKYRVLILWCPRARQHYIFP
jgi:hypothetical protein